MERTRQRLFSAVTLLCFLIYSPIHFVQQTIFRVFSSESSRVVSFSLPEVYAAVLTTIDEVLGKFFKDGEKVVEENHRLTDAQLSLLSENADLDLKSQYHSNYRFYVGRKGGDVTGYAAQDAVPGKWGLIHYAIHLSPQGKVKDVVVTQYSEKRGKPVAKKRFLKQFRGKDKDDRIKLMKDIKGVTGASMSSSGMTNGIRKMVHAFDLLYGEKA